MFRFIETIRISEGAIQNLAYHTARFRKTRGAFFSLYDDLNLADHISVPQQHAGLPLLKCRIIYGKTIEKVEFTPYQARTVNTLKIVHADTIQYSYKYEDRDHLDALLRRRDGCDDIIIVKNKLVTDSYYANLALKMKDQWITPASPLLKGTRREFLLDTHRIREEQVTLDDLKNAKSVRLINAMIDLREAKDIDTGHIKF